MPAPPNSGLLSTAAAVSSFIGAYAVIFEGKPSEVGGSREDSRLFFLPPPKLLCGSMALFQQTGEVATTYQSLLSVPVMP